PRSVRLRQEVSISLDDVYMGVIVQEEVPSTMGGVLVTTNPANRADFRNVYINASKKSVVHVVSGTDLPYQFLYNTVERAGKTLTKGSATQDLSEKEKSILQNLAICGRLLQSHFSASYTFSDPVDIEWLANGDELYILQLRPYAK
ncbi:MAG: phosphoenolpyruvate synthase, partial [Proteobacteria bacterium]